MCPGRVSRESAGIKARLEGVSIADITRTVFRMANPRMKAGSESSAILDSGDTSLYDVTTKADGPGGSLPLTEEMLTDWPSGDLFGLSQNAGMGWTATEVTIPF